MANGGGGGDNNVKRGKIKLFQGQGVEGGVIDGIINGVGEFL